jgi:hypothetical protein
MAKPKHGMDHAAYYGGPGEPYFQPVMECLCGWSTTRSENWETAGRAFDQHLKEKRNEHEERKENS